MESVQDTIKEYIQNTGRIPKQIKVSNEAFAEAFLRMEIDWNMPRQINGEPHYSYMGIQLIPSGKTAD